MKLQRCRCAEKERTHLEADFTNIRHFDLDYSMIMRFAEHAFCNLASSI